MRLAWVSAVAAMLIALLAMTAVAETPAPQTTGIEGTISVSPVQPGPITRDSPTSAPVPHVQFLVKTGENTVATFTTDAEGRFRVALPPGHYVVVKSGVLPPIGRWRFETEVAPGEVKKVTWVADSGMR